MGTRTDTAVDLGLLFQQIVEASTDSSALKLRKRIAQSKFDRRLADFKGCELVHEKFPAMAEDQARSKDRAERALKSISEEVLAKKSSLDGLASQVVTQFIPHMITANARYGRSESDARTEELEKKFKAFEERLEVQHTFMLNLQKTHEENYRSSEDKYLKLRDEAACAKATMVEILKSLSEDVDAAKEAVAQVKEQIPLNLQPRLEKLDTLFERVDKFPNLRLDIDKIKQEAAAQAKARHNDRLEAAAWDTKLSGIETRYTNVEIRLRALEIRPLTPPESLNTLSRMSSMENQTQSLSKSFSNISDRFQIMSNEILATKKKVGTLEERVTSQDDPTGIEKSSVPAIDFDTLKSEMLKVVEEKQAAADTVVHTIFTQLQADIKRCQNQLEHVEKKYSDMKTAYGPITAVPQQMEQLKATLKLGNVQLVADAAKNALDLIRSQPDLLPYATIESQVLKDVDIKLEFVNKKHELLSQTVTEKLEANTDGLRSLDRRFNNINTKNQAIYILSQLESIYPDLRNTQKSLGDLVELVESQQRQDIVLNSFSDAITSLQTTVDGLSKARTSSQEDEQTIHTLRGKVDELTLNVGKVQGAVMNAKKEAETANERLATIEKDYAANQVEIASRMSKLRVDLDEVKDHQQPLPPVNQQQPLRPLATSSRAPGSAAIPSRSVSTSDALRPAVNPHGFSQKPASAQRAASAQSPINKKRKLNGTPLSHGVMPGLKAANGTQRKRRHKFSTDISQLDEDDSEDSTFEPNQPTISDPDD